MHSQDIDLKQHQWKNRILIVKAENQNNEDFKHQLKEISNFKNGFIERKLVLYKVDNEEIIFDNQKIGAHPKVFEHTSHEKGDIFLIDKDFEVILIGLDGSIKLRQNKILKMSKLFDVIDAMPMRRREINNKN